MEVRPIWRAVTRMVMAIMTTVLVASTLSILSTSHAQAQSASSARLTAAHPVSDPLWFPLRTSALIGCAVSNCSTSSNHHYWAIDFIGRQGQPIYAAGAGIAHIGSAPGSGCATTSVRHDGGNWIWVDHGGGLVTKYHHVDKILITNGQRVSPATEIATMGHSGDISPCRTNYLHFEIRSDGLTGPRVAIPSMSACTSAGRISLPQYYGASSWNSPVIVHKMTPTTTNSCLAGDWVQTPAAPAVAVRAANSALTVSWGARPAGTDAVMIRTERYSTALHAYGRPYHYKVPASSSSKTFTAMTNGRTYKVVVAFHNRYGYSAWSTLHAIKPGAVPTVGGSPRYLVWQHGAYVHYGWNRSLDNGSPITHYEVASRCQASNSSWGGWAEPHDAQHQGRLLQLPQPRFGEDVPGPGARQERLRLGCLVEPADRPPLSFDQVRR